MFCAAFRCFVVVWCERYRVLPCSFTKASILSSLILKSTLSRPGLHSSVRIRPTAQFISSGNMSPRGKAKAKKDVGENGKEKRVRESRNVKAASYKDLSDSEDEKPLRKRKQESDSEESISEEEMPKKKAVKGRRAPARSKKDLSESEEASDFSGSDESSGNERKRRQSARKPARSLRTQRETSYKDLSDSDEDSAVESKSSSEKEEKSPSKSSNKRGRSAKAPSKSLKEESSASGSDNDGEDPDEPESEKHTEADSANNSKVKDESSGKDNSSLKTKDKSRPDHALSEEEVSDKEDDKELEDKKEEIKKEENDSKKRSRTEKSDGDSAKTKPPAKKAKVDEKPKLNRTDTDYDKIDFSSESKSQKGEPWNFKISSWNVASLRTWIQKGGLDFIKYEKPDILCLQETKCSEKKLPSEAKVEGYHSYWCSGEKEGYAGVALLSKVKPLNVEFGVGKPEFDIDGRVITAEFEKFFVVNVYVPNAGQGLKTLPRREEWDPVFRAHLKKLDEKKPVILCGDMNVSHLEIDLANPKTNTKSAGFTPQEREGMTKLLEEGFVDTFRKLYPDKTGAYSFWTYLQNARSRNVGWRLDYFITSERFYPSVCDNVIRSEVYGSDHCPITLFAHME